MRASRQEQIGGAGVSEVMAAFQRLGWGPMENSRHDLGTDVFALARDERGFELGLIVGLQIKTGASWFRRPVRNASGDQPGWWFYDHDRSHVEAWASHGVPHLLVLHDLDTKTSYWAHVTSEAIVATGKGAKVLVPAANTVDEEDREALLTVAATMRSGVAWEGSAWTGAVSLPARDVLRHALIVPRIIAPHPNAGKARALTPEQAVALLVQGRIRDLEDFATMQPGVPSLSEASESPDWCWRFVSALGERVTTGEIDGLLEAVNGAPDAPRRAASTVAAASALLDDARADQAVTLLEAALASPDESGPVDYAWLTVQRARAYAEIGRVEDARADALAIQAIRASAPNDITATAMAGAAVALLFNTASWGPHEPAAADSAHEETTSTSSRTQTTSRGLETPVSVGEPGLVRYESIGGVIEGADTTVTWWRTQTTSWGLNAVVERTFSAWAQEVTTANRDLAGDQLGAAALSASHLGDHGGWRHQAGLLGRDMLLRLDRCADPEMARRGLARLRLAGEEDALKLAVRHLAADGPASAVTLAAADVLLATATRTTAPAELALLQYGGDLLDQQTVDRTLPWLLATLADPEPFAERTSPSYLVELRLLETIAAIAPHASAGRTVIEHLIALPAQQDQLLAGSWARVVRALPDEAWSEETARLIAQRADAHHSDLRMALLRVAARYDEEVKTRLKAQVRSGSLDALSALGDVRALSTQEVRAQIDALAAQVEQQVRDAEAGSYGFGGHDLGADLAVLNAWHPDAAQWNPLLELLANNAVARAHKRGALQSLASLAEQIPETIKSRLRPIARSIAEQTSPEHTSLFDNERDLAGEGANLAVALGSLEQDWTARMLLELLSGSPDHRYWATLIARRLNRPQEVGLLVALAQDAETDVRAGAAAGLASLVAKDEADALVVSALQRCLQDPGRRVPATVAVVLAGENDLGSLAQTALEELRSHHSAYVRATAIRALKA